MGQGEEDGCRSPGPYLRQWSIHPPGGRSVGDGLLVGGVSDVSLVDRWRPDEHRIQARPEGGLAKKPPSALPTRGGPLQILRRTTVSNRVACGIVVRIARQVPARISDGRAGRQCEHHGHNGGADR